ncbi:MAG: alpha/beta hydrolase [Nakamurella sp.]
MTGGGRAAGRAAGWASAGLTALAGAALVVVDRSPRPVVRLVKELFERGGAAMAAKLRPHVPDGVTSTLGVPYRDDDADARLSVHRRTDAVGTLPVVVWVHGGGWVSGSSTDVDPYLEILAARTDVVTVSVDYTLGPNAQHPTAVHQIDDALRFLTEHAARWQLDPERVVLAGDSAGAQLVTEYAALVTNPDFAAAVGTTPFLPPDRLRGMVLHCGVYDLAGLVHAPGLIGWGVEQVIWAYTGSRSLTDNPVLDRMTSTTAVSAHFPPTLMSAGNGDPLTPHQSVPFAARLVELGVPVETHFAATDHVPSLGHEYQFDLAGTGGAAERLLDRTVTFLRERLGGAVATER